MRSERVALRLGLALGLLIRTAAAAAEAHCHAAPAAASTPGAAAEPPAEGTAFRSGPLRIPDTPLLDEDGKEVRFYRDVVAGKLVAIHFIFTTCTTICPPMGATFGKLQKLLAERAGRPVELVSISIDPATDTPPRLKAWRARFGTDSHWTLLTGSKPRVDALLRALGVAAASANDHTPILLVGDEPRGLWQRVYGLAAPQEIAGVLEILGAGKTAAAEVGR